MNSKNLFGFTPVRLHTIARPISIMTATSHTSGKEQLQ